jgi:hypothetical protein
MSLNPNIDYTVILDGGEVEMTVKVQLLDLEAKGLEKCLREKIKQPFNTFSVKFRRYHAHPKEDNARPAPIWRQRGKTSNDFTAGLSPEDEKKYSVDLSEVMFDLVDCNNEVVTAINPRKAIVRALHKCKVYDFPHNWQNNAKVTEL